MKERKPVKKRRRRKETWLVGIDEAGRGPLAGPVAIGMVAVPTEFDEQVVAGVRDSKQLSPRERDAWFTRIKDLAKESRIRYQVSLIGAGVIDTRGITKAISTGIKNVLSGINPETAYVLLDGGLRAPKEFKQKTIIKGDELMPVISLASIAAKVTRDRRMTRYAKQYPEYQFEKHKGYGTIEHRESIEKYGVSPLHRKTFIHIREAGEDTLDIK